MMIKQKYGIAIFSFLAIFCISLSIYFFQKEILFAVGFAVGFVICTLCAYSEFLYENNKKIKIDNHTITEVVINYSAVSLTVTFLGYLILIIAGIYFVSLAGFDYKNYERFEYIMVAIAFFIIISYIIKSIKLLKKFSKKDILIINNHSIILNSERMLWDDIKNEMLIKKQEVTEGSKYEVDVQYLSLKHKNKKIEFKIDDLNQPDYLIDQYLKIFRNRFQIRNSNNDNIQTIKKEASFFENILKFNDLFSLSEKEFQKSIQDIRYQAEKYPDELKLYCESITDFEDTNLNSIYYALSEDTDVWKEFLPNEFIRLFEIAKKSNQQKAVFIILDEILYDSEPSSASRKVINYLYKELSNNDDKIRLKALLFIDLWLDDEDLSKANIVIQKIQKMTKDNNWKIRWCANDILSSYNIYNKDEIAISFQDKINAKLSNQYEID